MTLIKICPICLRNYRDISLNFCTDDGSALSDIIEVRANSEQEIETVIRHRKPEPALRSESGERKVYERDADRFLEAAVRKHSNLAFHVNSGNEHCVQIVGRENGGSLWIRPRPRSNSFRIQTTGQAQQLDPFIEDHCGPPVGSSKRQDYKYWYVDPDNVEKIIDRFATLP